MLHSEKSQCCKSFIHSQETWFSNQHILLNHPRLFCAYCTRGLDIFIINFFYSILSRRVHHLSHFLRSGFADWQLCGKKQRKLSFLVVFGLDNVCLCVCVSDEPSCSSRTLSCLCAPHGFRQFAKNPYNVHNFFRYQIIWLFVFFSDPSWLQLRIVFIVDHYLD